MKKLSLLLLLLTSLSFAKLEVAVSLIPQKVFVEKIGADHVNVMLMVKQGASPHTYEPKASQMKELANATVYFTIGVEFEHAWLSKFENVNKKLLFVDCSKGIEKYHLKEHHATHEEEHEEIDPHVWVDPINVKIIAKNIYETLVALDEKNKADYLKNYKSYLKELDALHKEIEEILKDTPKNAAFMVFHPAWGYFAKRYDLRQLAVEVEGKEPKMKALVALIKEAKKEKVRAIFTQPEFSDKASRNIANNLEIKVIKASPLAENWAENLTMLAKAIAGKK